MAEENSSARGENIAGLLFRWKKTCFEPVGVERVQGRVPGEGGEGQADCFTSREKVRA